jgi:hypothetical protein
VTLARALAGDLRDWQGLSPTESVKSLADALAPVAGVEGPDEQIRTTRRFGVVRFDRPARPHAVEAWFPFGSDYAALVEYDDPVVEDVDELLAAYGPPELEELHRRFADGALVREEVFATRGVTLSVATPFDVAADPDPPAGVRSVVHVQLYPPTSAAQWLTDIGAGPELRPYPPAPFD